MLKNIKKSVENMMNVRGLVLAGMLLAIHALLGTFKIPIASDNRITLTFAASATAGAVLGPVPAMLVAGLGDVLGYMLNQGGGAYFYGFTISGMVGGFIYGLCLYRKNTKHAFWWVILAVFLVTFFVNIILNTYWLSVMNGKAVTIFASARIIKNFVTYPVHVIVIFALFMLTDRIGVRKKYL